MTKPKPTADGFTYPQRRILSSAMDLFDAGSSVVTVSDLFTRLASESPPVSEREIRTQLESLTPEHVTKIRPELQLSPSAWSKMKRTPAPTTARAPSTPIAEAVTAQPVPIAPPPVAPALREPPKTPVRKPSAPLSLGTVKVAERPKSDVTILAVAPEVDPEAVKRALAMESRPLPILGVHSEANEADVDRLVTQLADATANTDNAFQPVTIGPVFHREDRETLTELALRYLRARGHEGATAAEAQADTGWDLVTTLCDITRRGRAVGAGNGSRHNGKNGIKDPPRRRWWAAEFAPEGLVAEVRIGKKARADAEQLADVQAERDRLRQRLRDFDDAHADDVALMWSALGVAGKSTWGELLTFAREVVKERDQLRADVNTSQDHIVKTWNDFAEALGFTEARKTVVGDLARALNVQVEHTDAGEAYFWLLDVARKRVPLDVGITNLIADETAKHAARIEALRAAHAIAKAST